MKRQLPRLSRESGHGRFQHEAVFYRGPDHLAAATVPFILEGLERAEPVLIAVLPDRIRSLRSSLGSDADRVTFLDMAEVGRNPARIIPVWRQFVHESTGQSSVRGIGEPVWSTRKDAEIEECHLHESLLNVAFDEGPAWRLICPYDVDALPAQVIEDASRTHPITSPLAGARVGYGGHDHARAGFASPLSPRPETTREVAFAEGDLSMLRRIVQKWSLGAGLPDDKAGHLVLAVNELATNSITHGGGRGVLHAWAEPGSFVVEVCDSGRISDPLVGRDLALDVTESGRGVWIVNQLCDLVQVRSLATGAVVRVHTWL